MCKVLLAILVALFFFVGCAKDKNVDDYRREKVEEEVAKIQSVAGTYRGILHSKNQRPVFALTVHLEPDTKIIPQVGDYRAQEQAVLSARVVFDGKKRAVLVFKDGIYNSFNHTFKATSILKDKHREITLTLSGTLSGNTLNGIVECENYPESGGTFSITRDAAAVAASQITHSPDFVPYNREFRGNGKLEQPTSRPYRDVRLVITECEFTTESYVSNFFVPIKYIDVSWIFAEDLHIPFKAQWDLRTGVISGEGQGHLLGAPIVNKIYCEPAVVDEDENGLSCRHTHSFFNTIMDARFKRREI